MDRSSVTITGDVTADDIYAVIWGLKSDNIKPEADGLYILYIPRESYQNLLRNEKVQQAMMFMATGLTNPLILYGAKVIPYDM